MICGFLSYVSDFKSVIIIKWKGSEVVAELLHFVALKNINEKI